MKNINQKKYKNFIKKKQNDLFGYYNTITFNSIIKPLTILLGPNGCGKSTTIRSIKDYCEKNKIDIVDYSTSKNDIVNKSSSPFGQWDISGIACAFHSEGERMSDSFFKWMNTDLLKAVLTNREKPLVILIDESDSGLSIDKIYETYKSFLFVLGEEIKKKREIKVIISCNSYELAEILKREYTSYIWIPTKEEVEFNNYEEFKEPYRYYWEEMDKYYERSDKE